MQIDAHITKSERIALPRRLVPRRAEHRNENRCAMIINGERLLVNINVTEIAPGTRAVVINSVGQLVIQKCDPNTYDTKSHGAVTALGPSYKSPYGGVCRDVVIVVGTVLASEAYT